MSDPLFKRLQGNLEHLLQTQIETRFKEVNKSVEGIIGGGMKKIKKDSEHNKNITKNMIEGVQERIAGLMKNLSKKDAQILDLKSHIRITLEEMRNDLDLVQRERASFKSTKVTSQPKKSPKGP